MVGTFVIFQQGCRNRQRTLERGVRTETAFADPITREFHTALFIRHVLVAVWGQLTRFLVTEQLVIHRFQAVCPSFPSDSMFSNEGLKVVNSPNINLRPRCLGFISNQHESKDSRVRHDERSRTIVDLNNLASPITVLGHICPGFDDFELSFWAIQAVLKFNPPHKLTYILVFATEFHVKCECDTTVTDCVNWWSLRDLPSGVRYPSSKRQRLPDILIATHYNVISSSCRAPHVPPRLIHVEFLLQIPVELVVYKNSSGHRTRSVWLGKCGDFDVIKRPHINRSIVFSIALAPSKRCTRA